MKINLFLFLLTAFIIHKSSTIVISQNPTYEVENYKVINDGRQLKMPFTGAFNLPQPQNIDLNRDGIDDFVVFDRDNEFLKTFIGVQQNGSFTYNHNPSYESIFPSVVNFMKVVDFNKDDIGDLFVGFNRTGIPGIKVYRGKVNNGSLTFELMAQAERSDNMLTYRSSSGADLVINTSPIDVPAIDDVDYDGDTDILTFQPGSGNVYLLKNIAVEKGLGTDTLELRFEDICYGKFFESDLSENITLSPSPDECAITLMENTPVDNRHAGSTITSIDLNDDNLKDLLIGDLTYDSLVALFNGGTQENAWMVDQDPAFPSDNKSVYLPNFLATFKVDVDQNGKMDFLVAPNQFSNSELEQNLHYYRKVQGNQGTEYQFQEDDFLIGDMLDLSSHAVPAIADINQDGLPDIVVGTYGSFTGSGERTASLNFIENTGTAALPEFTVRDMDYLGMSDYADLHWAFAPTFGDLDGDGDMDLLVGDYQGGLFYFENTAGQGNPMTFAEAEEDFMAIEVSNYAIPQIIDINKDGLGDIILGEQNGNSDGQGACGSINYYENVGAMGQPMFNPDEMMSPNTPCFGKVFTRYLNTSRAYTSPFMLDVAGDLRLITGDYEGNISYFDASDKPMETFPRLEKNIADLNTGRHVHPRMANLDADDFYELIVGTRTGGLIIYKSNWKINGEILSQSDVAESEILLYPNPASQLLSIEKIPTEVSRISLYSSRGMELRTVDNTTTSVKWDVSSYTAGVYFIVFYTPGQVVTKKVVVQ